jgi:hypothetical protein
MERTRYWPEDHCRVLVWSWVEQQTQSPTLVFKRPIDIMNIYNFKLEIFNVCMFIIISL